MINRLIHTVLPAVVTAMVMSLPIQSKAGKAMLTQGSGDNVIDSAIAHYGYADTTLTAGTDPGLVSEEAMNAYKHSLKEARNASPALLQEARQTLAANLHSAYLALQETNPITEGYYYIVTAGNGTGYYTGSTPPSTNYNYENKDAMYNNGDAVSWKTYDPTSFDQIYLLSPDGEGNWFMQSALYGTYIDKGLSTYGEHVSTSSTALTAQTFTLIGNGKYTIQFRGNPYVYSMRANHNGSSSAQGHLYIWGTPAEAKKFGVNVWYIHRVPDDVITRFEQSDAGFTAAVNRYSLLAQALKTGTAPGYYDEQRVSALKELIAQAQTLANSQPTQQQRDDMIARLEAAYSNAMVVNEITDGYYALTNNNQTYATLYGNSPAVYTVSNNDTPANTATCRYDKYAADNPNFVYYFSKTDNPYSFSVRNAYTGLYLNAIDTTGGSQNSLTCSRELISTQIMRPAGVGAYRIFSEADSLSGYGIAGNETVAQNGVITATLDYNSVQASSSGNGSTWSLLPITQAEAMQMIADRHAADSLALLAYRAMTDYNDSIQAQYQIISLNDSNRYNQDAIIALKDKERAVLSLIDRRGYDITSTAADYDLAAANLRAALSTALTAKPDAASFGQLSGTPIGAVSVDYSTSQRSTTVNTPPDVFDGDYSTFYASYERSTGWVGLDLGQPYIIKRVAYAPRANFSTRMVLGVFEGANRADFSDAIPFYIIKDEPEYGVLTTAKVSCSRGFRYVRYVGPDDSRTNISELRFFGTAGRGDDTHLYQLTNIPLVVIRTDADISEITSKTTYLPGRITIISSDGSACQADSMKVRGRGNGSWTFQKKPYKFKMEHKHRLLGMPANAKTWVLINNYGDKSLIRNNVAFKLSEIFRMDYTPAIRLVDVVFNGQYKGSYQLCDQVEVRKNRVDITKMDTDDNAGDSLTGGYLIEIDAYADGEPKHFYSSPYSMPVTVHYPKDDEITTAQFNYIQQAFNDFCQRVYSGAYKDSAQSYAAVLDQESWLKYFLIEELSGNTDGYYSVFMTKDRGDKFRVSPVWDFDLAFDNDKRTHPILTMTDFLSLSSRSSAAQGAKNFNRKIVTGCANELKELWSWYRYRGNLNYEYLKAVIDSLGQENSQSAEYNYIRWDILNTCVQQQYTTRGSYRAEVDFLNDYLYDRLAWMDNKVGLEEPIGIHAATDAEVRGGIHGYRGYILIRGFEPGAVAEVYSIVGERIKHVAIQDFNDTEIPLPKGIYIIKVTGTKGQMKTQKVAVE